MLGLPMELGRSSIPHGFRGNTVDGDLRRGRKIALVRRGYGCSVKT